MIHIIALTLTARGSTLVYVFRLCYGSTTIIIVYSVSEGIDFRRQNLTSKVVPRAERVNARYKYAMWERVTLQMYVVKTRSINKLSNSKCSNIIKNIVS